MKRLGCALLPILLASPVHAEWTQKDYAGEHDGCLSRCDKNNPQDHAKCTAYCHCVTDRMQSEFAGHDQLAREVIEQKLPDRIAILQKLANRCNQQIWGNPARKLKFQ
jgi:hypothetical protein